MTETSSDSFTVYSRVCAALREHRALPGKGDKFHPVMQQAGADLSRVAVALAKARVGEPDTPKLSSLAELDEWISLAAMTGDLALVEAFPHRKACSVPRPTDTTWADVRDAASSAYLIACMTRGLDITFSERPLLLRALRDQDRPLQDALYKTLAPRANPASWLDDLRSEALAEHARFIAKYLRTWTRRNAAEAAIALAFAAEQADGRTYAILRLVGADHHRAMTECGYGRKLLPAITNHEWLVLSGGATTAEQYLSQPQLHAKSKARFTDLALAALGR